MPKLTPVPLQVQVYKERSAGFPTEPGRKFIVWDGDGVVFNSMHLYTQMFSDVLYDFGKASRSASGFMYQRTAGMDLRQQFLQRTPEKYSGVERERFVDRCVEEFWKRLANYMPPLFEDFVDASQSMRSYRNVLASGTRQDVVDKRISHYGLGDFFKEHVGWSESMNKRKFLEQVHEKMKYGIFDKVLFVGDGRADMRNAKELEFVGVGVIRDDPVDEREMMREGATFVINDLRNLEYIAKAV